MTVGEAKYTYWQSMIELANASGMGKEEWCRKNCVSIKTFNHYEGVFSRQEARRGEYEEGHPDSPFYEIPMLNADDIVADVDEQEVAGNAEGAERASGDRPREDSEELQIGRGMANKRQDGWKTRNGREKKTELSIQSRNYRLFVYEGVSESTLRTLLEVMGLGNA